MGSLLVANRNPRLVKLLEMRNRGQLLVRFVQRSDTDTIPCRYQFLVTDRRQAGG